PRPRPRGNDEVRESQDWWLFARNAPTTRARRRAPGRPRHPRPRRTRERARSGGDLLDAAVSAPPRLGVAHRSPLLTAAQRGTADGGRPGRDPARGTRLRRYPPGAGNGNGSGRGKRG